jgi:hypothetical protein
MAFLWAQLAVRFVARREPPRFGLARSMQPAIRFGFAQVELNVFVATLRQLLFRRLMHGSSLTCLNAAWQYAAAKI